MWDIFLPPGIKGFKFKVNLDLGMTGLESKLPKEIIHLVVL